MLSELRPLDCDLTGMNDDEKNRAEKVIEDANTVLGVPKIATSEDILKGNSAVLLPFCAEIFLREHGLSAPEKFNEKARTDFARILNQNLMTDPELSDLLPLNPKDNSLFSASRTGILPSKYLLAEVPGSSAKYAVIFVKKPLKCKEIHSNLANLLWEVQEVHSKGPGITALDIAKGRPGAILRLYSEILRVGLNSRINVEAVPALRTLKREEENEEGIAKMEAKELLMRWVNFHVANAKADIEEVKDFGEDLKVHSFLMNFPINE